VLLLLLQGLKQRGPRGHQRRPSRTRREGLERRAAAPRKSTEHAFFRAWPRLLATPSVTSVQIEHAVLLVVLLGRHISRRVGIVVDPPDLFLSAFYSIFIFFSLLPCAGLLTLSFFARGQASSETYDTPENDYGGLISTLSFESADEQKDADGPVGLLVRGVPACKKKGQSKEHIPENSKGHMAVLYALLLSCANIPFFGYFSRFAAIRGANTKWHTDANTLFVKQSRESASSSRR